MNISITKVILLLQVSAPTSNPNFHSFDLIVKMLKTKSESIRIPYHVLILISKLTPFHSLTLSITILSSTITASIIKCSLLSHELLLPPSVSFLGMIAIIKGVLLMIDHGRKHLPTRVLSHRRTSFPVHTSS